MPIVIIIAAPATLHTGVQYIKFNPPTTSGSASSDIQYEVTYTSRVFSGICGGMRVKTDKNQHASHTKNGTPDLIGNDLYR